MAICWILMLILHKTQSSCISHRQAPANDEISQTDKCLAMLSEFASGIQKGNKRKWSGARMNVQLA